MLVVLIQLYDYINVMAEYAFKFIALSIIFILR